MNTPIRQRFATKRKENILAVFFALILSFGVYIVGHNTGLLTADVVGGPQVEFNDNADLVTATKGEDSIIVFAGKNMSDVETMSIILLFDPQRMKLDTDAFHSVMNFSYSAAGEGQGTLVLTNTKNKSILVKDELVEITAPGSFYDLVVGDAVVSFRDGSKETLSVKLPQ